MQALIPPLQALIPTPHIRRDLGGSETVTQVVTATATPVPTTVTATSTQTPLQTLSNASSGPTSSPLLFFVLLAIGILLVLTGICVCIYCCATRKRRVAAREATAATELQPTVAQAAPQSEVYGYYAPAGTGVGRGRGEGGGKEEQAAAAREVYGYFSPSLAPRVGDGVVARPGRGT